jgi:hypothetical protein
LQDYRLLSYGNHDTAQKNPPDRVTTGGIWVIIAPEV